MRCVLPLVAAILLSSCGSGSDEEIAFTVNRGGWSEIRVMNVDGTGSRRLTEVEPPQNDASGSREPAWSPDGTHIAFAAQIGTRVEDQSLTEIYVMRSDGTDRRRLTTNTDLDSSPSWSPDGEQIALTRIADPGTAKARSGIFVIDAAGGGREVQLTRTRSPTFDGTPDWSPDGSKIAFTRFSVRGLGSERPRFQVGLYVVGVLGHETRELASEGGDPDWSPDGRLIAFVSARDRLGQTCFHDCSPNGEIYVMRADGREQRRLATSAANDTSPAWSPDGGSLAFVSDRSNPQRHENEIYVMNADGGDVRPLTENVVSEYSPAWRPSG